jgi:hypothetical protein
MHVAMNTHNETTFGAASDLAFFARAAHFWFNNFTTDMVKSS